MIYLMATNTDYVNGRLTGAHFRFLELAKGLAKENKVIIISKRIPQLENEENIVFYYIKGNCPRFFPDHIATMLLIAKMSRKIKKHEEYDASISFTPFISIAYRLGGIKKIASLFREDLIGYHNIIGTNKFKIFYYRLIELLAVKCSDQIIVQCQDDKKNLTERLNKFEKRVDLKVKIQINNANASWMKSKLRDYVENDVPNILFIGEYSNLRKGHHILLSAASRLQDEGYNFLLFMAGDGCELPKYIKKYEHYSQIRFLGRIKVSDYLEKADFVVVPSLIDSCPNTVLEALNAGVAVYGSSRGGIVELLEESQYMFEPTEESLYQFLKNVLDSRRYVDDCVEQQKRKEELCFDWAKKIEVQINGQMEIR